MRQGIPKVLFDRYHDFRDYHSSGPYHAAYSSSWVEWECRQSLPSQSMECYSLSASMEVKPQVANDPRLESLSQQQSESLNAALSMSCVITESSKV